MAARPSNASRVTTLNILAILHLLLVASLLSGLVNAGAIPIKATPANSRSVATKLIAPLAPKLSPTRPAGGVAARQLHPTFQCPANTNCKGATACLYPDPDACNRFIHCDQDLRPWVDYCPMESMVWNDKVKLCDYGHGEPCKDGR